MKLVQLKELRIAGQVPGLLFGLCAFSLVCCLALGGGTRGGFLSDAVLQLLTLPLLLAALWHLVDVWRDHGLWRANLRWPLAFCLTILLLPLLQLVPLPPLIWTRLPHREALVSVLQLVGEKPPWRALSVSPQLTWLSVLSLVPPLAIFLGAILLGYRERRWLSLVVLAMGIVSVFLGLLQVSQGPSSPLRFFAFTNLNDAVGFFANRNHLAALLYSLTLIAAVWAIDASFKANAAWDRKGYNTSSIVAVVASFTVLVIVIAAQAMTRSRVGIGLSIIAVFGGFALAFADRRVAAGSARNIATGLSPAKLLIAATCLALLFAVPLTLYRVMERFSFDPLEDARIPIARNTIQAAKDFMPFGVGMGAFVPVYQTFEKPADVVANAYVNHAHDDILELWLESGVFGLALIALFAGWVVFRAMRIWRQRPGIRDVDQTLARAATLIIGLLAAHSFFDYPLRTEGMMAVMAFACALLIEPRAGTEPLHTAAESWRQTVTVPRAASLLQERPGDAPPERSRRLRRQSQPVREPPMPMPQTMELWGKDAEWPEEWRGTAKQDSSGSAGKAKPRKTPQD